jgi:hypothetical protein
MIKKCMEIKSNPLHCTLVFDFSVNDKNYTVSLYQDLTTNDKVVNVLNTDGSIVDDANLCELIVKYAIDKYSITYDPGTDDNNLDPVI